MIYLISCVKCGKNYLGSTITSFRKRFNNHKSSINRYGRGQRGQRGQRGMAGEHLYAHFFEMGHRGIEDMLVTIIDQTNTNEPTQREGFWTYRLNSFVPHGLNQRDVLQLTLTYNEFVKRIYRSLNFVCLDVLIKGQVPET